MRTDSCPFTVRADECPSGDRCKLTISRGTRSARRLHEASFVCFIRKEIKMTNRLIHLSLISTSILLTSASIAGAEPTAGTSATYQPIHQAIEIGVTGGYTRALGNVDGGMDSIDELTGAGGRTELQVGYRITPNLAIGTYGSLSLYSHGDALEGSNNDLGAVTTGLKADWHLSPASDKDPWVSLSSGVRWMAIEEGGAAQRHLFGLDLARAQVGFDYRVSRSISIAPVLGVTATTFVRENNAMTDGWDPIDDKKVSVGFEAGLMGRFDLFAR